MTSELGCVVSYIILYCTIILLAIVVMQDDNTRKKLHKFGRLETKKGTYTFTPKGEISK